MDTEQQRTEKPEDSEQKLTEKPEVTEEHKEQAKEMRKAYEDDRPTVTLPGSDNTVSGTAIADWTDEEGNKIAEDNTRDEE
jgi:hypothetical protein